MRDSSIAELRSSGRFSVNQRSRFLDGLRGWYVFSEGGQSMLRNFAPEGDPSLLNIPGFSGEIRSTPDPSGTYGAVPDFTGNDEYFEVPFSLTPTLPFTIHLWLRTTDASGFWGLFLNYVSGQAQAHYHQLMMAGGGGGFAFQVQSRATGGPSSANTGVAANTGEWVLGTGVWAANNDRRVYHNGEDEDIDTLVVNANASNLASIGLRANEGTGSRVGQIREVLWYDRAVPQDEIRDYYESWQDLYQPQRVAVPVAIALAPPTGSPSPLVGPGGLVGRGGLASVGRGSVA